jgi:hypothetical protein
MANIATTTYKITGPNKDLNKLWDTLTKLGINQQPVYLDTLGDEYKIEYCRLHLHVRGSIRWGVRFDVPGEDSITLETESAWDACNDFFEYMNLFVFDDSLKISYRVCECGNGIYYVHDEGYWFPEECCVSCSDEPFDGKIDEPFNTFESAIRYWLDCMNLSWPVGKTTEEMLDYIKNYDYKNDDVYFYINQFTFE